MHTLHVRTHHPVSFIINVSLSAERIIRLSYKLPSFSFQFSSFQFFSLPLFSYHQQLVIKRIRVSFTIMRTTRRHISPFVFVETFSAHLEISTINLMWICAMLNYCSCNFLLLEDIDSSWFLYQSYCMYIISCNSWTFSVHYDGRTFHIHF